MLNNAVIGICFNGNSLYLLWRFASTRDLQLNCYVSMSLMPLAQFLGIKVKPISYLMIISDILLGWLSGRPRLLILPHVGGRFLRMLRRLLRTRIFVDDGFLYLGDDSFINQSDTVITYDEIIAFRAQSQLPCQCLAPASLLEYAEEIKKLPATSLSKPTHVVVSSTELDYSAVQTLADHLPSDIELRYIPHPRVYKNLPMYQSISPLQPSVAFGVDAVLLNNMDMISGITIGRSFTTYLLVAWLAAHGNVDVVFINRPTNCSRRFEEMRRFCDWLALNRKRTA